GWLSHAPGNRRHEQGRTGRRKVPGISRRHDARDSPASARIPRRAGRCSSGALGVLGSVACAASMILPAVRTGGPTAAPGMAGMPSAGPAAPGGALGVLVRIGPWLMLASALLVTAAFALTRRPVTAIPALLAGGHGSAPETFGAPVAAPFRSARRRKN